MMPAPSSMSSTYQSFPSTTPVMATTPPKATMEVMPCSMPTAPAMEVPIAQAIHVRRKSLPAKGIAPSVMPADERKRAEMPS